MLATAHELTAIKDNVDIVCVGTPKGLETTLVPDAGFELVTIDPVPLPRRITWALVTMPLRLMKAINQARKILRRRGADVVVGFGGYACLPVYIAARWLKIPVVVHEANAVPGLANRIGARFASRVCVTFPSTALPNHQVTGMPMSKKISQLDRHLGRVSARKQWGLDPQDFVLLVSGGSQGAMSLNKALWGASRQLCDQGVSILHITGKANVGLVPPSMPEGYQALAYVSSMDQAYAAADLMVGRAGAATVCETATVGLPTIFVPLPHGNGEQEKNAHDLVEAGGGIIVKDCELTSETMVELVTNLMNDPQGLTAMSQAGRAVVPRDSAQLLAQQVISVVEEGQTWH
jgi:UDP-N-acetylglucosamine--N-acetylmuramyl-(pentapeptide) pyrophosphoryl-undecaprenol N-acetylglucosamine transferase